MRGYVAFGALAVVGLGLTGCGGFRYEQRDPWRAQAEEACLAQKLVQPSAYMSRLSPIDGPGTCGISHPFKVAAFGDGSVSLRQQVTLACPMIPRIDTWLNEVVQPAASTYFGSTVVEVRSGSYSCRSRNNQRGAKLSEHSFGNAVDVMALRLADGREISIVKGWRGAQDEQEFLREIFVGACSYFTTVLGPGSDAFHYDHFHLDLARHDPRGERHVCKPVIKFTPRSGAEVASQARAPLREPQQPIDHAPIDDDADEDPFATVPTSARPSSSTYASARPVKPAQAYSVAQTVYNRPLAESAAGPASKPTLPAESSAAPRRTPPGEPMVLSPQFLNAHGIY